MKTKNKYITGRNVKNITILPNFILKLLGRIDARKGESVALAHLTHYLEKCTSIEDGECLISEEYLKKTRAEGASNLCIIEKIPDTPDDANPKHTWEVLEDRKKSSAKSRLYEINEEIINGTSILDQRIAKTRKRAASKIAAYIKGVRAGGIPSFDPDVSFSEAVVEKYYKKHKNDKAIAAVAAVSNYEED